MGKLINERKGRASVRASFAVNRVDLLLCTRGSCAVVFRSAWSTSMLNVESNMEVIDECIMQATPSRTFRAVSGDVNSQ